MSFLLDTNVVSELVRPRPDENVVSWLRERDPGELYLCVLTLGELTRGAEKIADTERGRRIQRWIDDELGEEFEGRILAFDRRAARRWGAMMGAGDRVGEPLPAADAQIAAIASVWGLTLVTRNVKDFVRMLDTVVDPFAPTSA